MKTIYQIIVLYIEPVVNKYILVIPMELLAQLVVGVQLILPLILSVLLMMLIIESYISVKTELSKILEIRQVVQQEQVQSVLVLQIMDMI